MRETLIRCTRCDRPICPDCMRPASVGFHCPDDVKLGQSTQRVPRTVVGAAVSNARPYVTWALLGLNILVYVITASTSKGGANDPHTSRLFSQWFMQPYLVAHNHAYFRLIGSAFLHVSLLHIASNMLALFLIGPPLERLLGWWRFGCLYLLSALGGGVAVYLFGAPATEVVGASGAIFGLFAACLFFVRELNFDLRSLLLTIGLNFILTFSIANISKLGHLGGFAIGGVVAAALAGVPWARRRLRVPVQVGGLVGVLAALLVAIVWRTAALS
jgi:membrane associated rhomboid family serine protease